MGADVHVVWQVLTDFEGMSRFVPSIRRSVPLAFSDGGLAVAQEFERRAFVFTRTVNVRLLVQEQPERQIVFRDVALQDFDTYEGSWQIEPSGRGSKVTYRLTAKPRGPVPAFVGRGAFKDAATEMLVELGNEMARRSKRPAQSTPPEGGTQ